MSMLARKSNIMDCFGNDFVFCPSASGQRSPGMKVNTNTWDFGSSILFFWFCTLLLSSFFWTIRGHRCRPFFPPRFLPSIFIPHRVQQSHCSSIYHRVLLTHALALSASQFVHKKKTPRMYTSMHSGGLELTKLTYTRLEDNLIRHRGNRLHTNAPRQCMPQKKRYSSIVASAISFVKKTQFTSFASAFWPKLPGKIK